MNTPTTPPTVHRALTLIVPLLACSAATASHPAAIEVQINGEPVLVLNQPGVDLDDGRVRYQGSHAHPDGLWNVYWFYVLDPDPADTASLVGNTSFTNSSGAAVAFDFSIASAICPVIEWQALYGGTTQVLLQSGPDGSLMTSLPGKPVWSARADGDPAAAMFQPPFSLGSSGAGTMSMNAFFGSPFPSQHGPAISDNAGLRLRYSITPDAVVTIYSSLFIGSPPGNLVACEDVFGDIDGDGVVDVRDLLVLITSWGPCQGCPADLNGDGVVDFIDLLILLENWS
jgi:hypothetical protein